MELHSYPRTIRDILTLKRTYIIPRFQREYSWGEEELYVLWEDLINNLIIVDNSIITKDYFFGAIVLVGNDSKDTKFLVVDGQQRLTTATIFFSALAEKFTQEGKTGLAERTFDYIRGKDNDDEIYYILENETPKPFFQFRIQDIEKSENVKPVSDEEKKIEFAYKFFSEQLSKEKLEKIFQKKLSMKDFNYIEALKILREQILQFSTIYITVAQLNDAYLIFETLNAKGKDLEPLDLVKNKIFQILPNELNFDGPKEKWKKMKENLKKREQPINTSTFFRHFWLAKYDFTTEGKLYDSFLKKIEPKSNNYNMLLNDLNEYSEIYCKIFNPLETDWKMQEEKFVYESLMAIKLFNISPTLSS